MKLNDEEHRIFRCIYCNNFPALDETFIVKVESVDDKDINVIIKCSCCLDCAKLHPNIKKEKVGGWMIAQRILEDFIIIDESDK